jgi:hypothetical protein
MEATGEEMSELEYCDGCLKMFDPNTMYRIDDYDEAVMVMCKDCYQPEARVRGKRR